MSYVVIPHPQPDELLEGLLGRMAAANGCTSVDNLIDGLQNAQRQENEGKPLWIIATAFDTTVADLHRRFTTVPALRAFTTEAKQRTPTWGGADGSLHISGLSRRSSTEALTCMTCVQRDIASGKQSYWRRSNHLPGVDWCIEHATPLIRFECEAFAMPPSEAIKRLEGHSFECPWNNSPTSVLGRYASLLAQWLQQPTSMSCKTLNRVAQEGCRRRDLRTGQVGKRPVISDRAKEIVPRGWLKKYWPALLSKDRQAFFARLDGISKDKHVAYASANCALALAVLFDSIEEIAAAFTVEQAQLDSQANASDAMLAARKAFISGQSLSSACNTHGIPIDQFEQWLRAAAKGWKDLRLTAPVPA
nr:TniQ family protein [uncultured Albidiferax sp.]